MSEQLERHDGSQSPYDVGWPRVDRQTIAGFTSHSELGVAVEARVAQLGQRHREHLGHLGSVDVEGGEGEVVDDSHHGGRGVLTLVTRREGSHVSPEVDGLGRNT